jgi:hypothetical protein
MRKGILLAILVLVGWQGPTPNEATSNRVQENTKTNQANSQNSVAVAGRPSSNDNGNHSTQNANEDAYQSVRIIAAPKIQTESEKDTWDKALVGATWALVIMGALQIVFLWRTVAATRDNAKAALKNAETIIKSERPWMLFTEIAGVNLEPIEAQQNRPTAVGLNFANSGKTVARITAWKFGLFITGVNQVPPPSVFDTSGVNFKPTVIPRKAPLPHLAQLDGGRIIKLEELRDITERHVSYLWLCGIIKYQDVFDLKNEHMTKICRRYQVFGIEPMFVLDGPAEYNDEN